MALVDGEQGDTSRSLADWGRGSVDDYLALLKPRVMALVVFTALVGMVLAPVTIPIVDATIALLCIAVGAGASGALNMWWDADIDARMSRTADRPIPAGRVAADEARNLGIGLSAASVLLLGLAANWLAAGLLAFTIFYYVVFYTMWLKRRTVQNIVIGGAAGAFPPMIGWAAVTGSISVESLILFLIILLWTPPHFWALALVKSGDYARANVPMLPVIEGPAETRWQILIYTLALVPITLLPAVVGSAGPIYLAVAVLSGAVFLLRAMAVYRSDTGKPAERAAWRLFGFSIFYLFLLFATMLIERVVRIALGAG